MTHNKHLFVSLKEKEKQRIRNSYGYLIQGSDKPGKPGKTAVFEGTQGKPGKLREFLMKFFKLRENSGKIFLKKDIIINYCLSTHYSFPLL